MIMLEILNLHKNFGGTGAVKDFSLSVEEGKITSIIGSNGSGKTTLFNLISGFLTPDSGEINFDNNSLLNLSVEKIARRGITRSFQEVRLFQNLTLIENVQLAIHGQNGKNLIHAIFRYSKQSKESQRNKQFAVSRLELVGLVDDRNRKTRDLSYGQQKLLSIACCLAAEPRLILLDEPVSGVQPEMINRIINLLQHLANEQNKTILFIEHNLDVVLQISDTVVVMDHGIKIAEGPCSVIEENPEILEAYLS